MGSQSPNRIELGRRVEARLIGLDDPEQPVAIQISIVLEPPVVGRDPRLCRRVADRDPPCPGEQRRLDRRRIARLARGDVVGPAPLPVDVAVPEDRVADEAVLGRAGQKAAELALGA